MQLTYKLKSSSSNTNVETLIFKSITICIFKSQICSTNFRTWVTIEHGEKLLLDFHFHNVALLFIILKFLCSKQFIILLIAESENIGLVLDA